MFPVLFSNVEGAHSYDSSELFQYLMVFDVAGQLADILISRHTF